MIRYLVFSIYIITCFSSVAQQSYDVLISSGKVVKNYPGFPEVKQNVIGRLAWSRQLSGEKEWHRYYYFPEFTLQALYGSLGNKNVLGEITGVNGGFRFKKTLNYRVSLFAEAQLGLAWFNKPFNEFDNNSNVAAGSHLSALGTADGGLVYALHPMWSLIGKVSILHCSNAHMALPNAGINLPMITAGVRYNPRPALMINTSEANVDFSKKPVLAIRIALGRGEQGSTSGPVNGPRYSILLAGAFINRHYTPVARWQMGLEAYYNDGTFAFITSRRFYTKDERVRSGSLLYILGHEYLFGNVGFVTQGGLYLYNPFARDYYKYTGGNAKDFLKTWIAARLGLHYYIFNPYQKLHKNLFAGCYVKTNFGKADFLEFTLGYSF